MSSRPPIEGGLGDAQRGVDAAQAQVASAQSDMDRADAIESGQTDWLNYDLRSLDEIEGRLAELRAAAVPESRLRRTTSVAYPPSVGHDQLADAAQARLLLASALATRSRLQREVVERQGRVEAAHQASHLARQALAAAWATLDQAGDQQSKAQSEAPAEDASAVARLARALTSGLGDAQTESGLAPSDIPAPYLALYRQAAVSCPGLSWTVLAGIGSIESDHGRLAAPGVTSGANSAGAMGPMQFLASTWSSYGADGDGDGVRDVYDPADAVFGAARYLCAAGAARMANLASAIWAYNHADWYVSDVLVRAVRYGSDAGPDIMQLLHSASQP